MDTDLLIIGAGPAGSLAGINAARLGLKTTIMDKEDFPRHKPCAGGLSCLSVDFLVDNDLTSILDNIPKEPFLGFKVYSGRLKEIWAPVKSKLGPGYVIDRHYFDNELLKKAKEQGCNFLPSTKAVDIIQTGDSVQIKTTNGWLKAKAAISADGSGISFTRKILPEAKIAGSYYVKQLFGQPNLQNILINAASRSPKYSELVVKLLEGRSSWKELSKPNALWQLYGDCNKNRNIKVYFYNRPFL